MLNFADAAVGKTAAPSALFYIGVSQRFQHLTVPQMGKADTAAATVVSCHYLLAICQTPPLLRRQKHEAGECGEAGRKGFERDQH